MCVPNLFLDDIFHFISAAPVCVRLAKPGEIRTEYEEQLRKVCIEVLHTAVY